MPEVDTPPDLAKVFNEARSKPKSVGVVTPGRMVMFMPAPAEGTIAAEHVESMKKMLPSETPLNIAVIGYNAVEALTSNIAKCIPFMGWLLGFAYVGHHVVVFEGHTSALEFGLRGADILLIDGGMLPFLEKGWALVAARAMNPGAKVLIYNRHTRAVSQLVRK